MRDNAHFADGYHADCGVVGGWTELRRDAPCTKRVPSREFPFLRHVSSFSYCGVITKSSPLIGLRARRDSRAERRPVHDNEIPFNGDTSARSRTCRVVVQTGTNTLPLDSPVEVEAIITVKPA